MHSAARGSGSGLYLGGPTSHFVKMGKTVTGVWTVVYLNQRTGAPHAVWWSKSFVFALKQSFLYFSITNGKKKGKQHKNTQKHAIKGGLPAFRCFDKQTACKTTVNRLFQNESLNCCLNDKEKCNPAIRLGYCILALQPTKVCASSLFSCFRTNL